MSGTMPIAQTITFNSLRMYRDILESDSKKDICVPRDEMAKFLLLLQDAPVSFETTCLNLKEDDQQIMTQLPRCNEIWRGKILRLELDGSLRQQTGNIVPAIKTASGLRLSAPGSLTHLPVILNEKLTALGIHDYEEQTWGKYAKDCAKSVIGNCSKLDLPVPHIVDWMFTVWTERCLVISTNLIWDKEVIQKMLEAIKERCTLSPEECSEPKAVMLYLLNKETQKTMSVAIENKYLQNITVELGSGDKDIAMLLRTCGHIWRDTDLDLALDDILPTLEESDRNAVILAISTARTLTLKSNCSTVYLEKLLNKNCFELDLVDNVKCPNVFEKMSNFFNGGQGALSLPVEKIVDWMFMPAPKMRNLTVETDMDLDQQELEKIVVSMFARKMSGTMPIAQTITFNSLRMYRDILESDSKKDICVPRDEMAKFLLLLQDAPVSFETTCLNLKEDDQQIMTQLPRCNEIWRGKILRLELDGNLRQQTGNIVPAIKTASGLRLAVPGSLAHLAVILNEKLTTIGIHDYEKQTWGKYAKDCAKSVIGNCSKLDLPVPHIVDWMFTVWTERRLVISTNLTWDKDAIQKMLEAIKERCTLSPEECSEPKAVMLYLLNKETQKTMSVAIENKYLQNITVELGSGDKDIAMLLRTCGHIWRDTDLDLALDDILPTLEESDRNAVILAISTARTLTLKSNCSTVYLEKLLNKNCFELDLVDNVKCPNVFEKMSNFFNGGQGALSLPVEKIVDWMFMPAPKMRNLTVETDMDLDQQELEKIVVSMFARLSTKPISHNVIVQLKQRCTQDNGTTATKGCTIKIIDNQLKVC